DRVTHRRLLDVRRDDPHLTELPGDASERRDPRAEDAVVVADQDPHLLNSNSSYRPRVGRRASRAGEHHSVTLTARSRKGCEDYPDVGPPLADTRRNDHFSSSSSRAPEGHQETRGVQGGPRAALPSHRWRTHTAAHTRRRVAGRRVRLAPRR